MPSFVPEFHRVARTSIPRARLELTAMDAIGRTGWAAGIAFPIDGQEVGLRVSDEAFEADLRRFAAAGAGEQA